MKRCILHMGTHKTGTSSLQRFLAANRPALLARGILNPAAASNSQGQSAMFVKRFRGEINRPQAQDCIENVTAELAATKHDLVVISAEVMSGDYLQRQDVAVPEFFASLGYDVTLVMYLRNQPQVMNSRYIQRVKTLHYAGDFAEFARSKEEPYRYDRLIGLGERGWKTIFRPYNQRVRKEGVEQDFLPILLGRSPAWTENGSDPAMVAELERFQLGDRANISHQGPVAIEAARRTREALERELGAAGRKGMARIRRRYDRVLEASGLTEAPFCGLTDAGAKAIEDRFREANDAFALWAWDAPWAEVFAGDVGGGFVCNDLRQSEDREKLAAADALTRAVLAQITERDQAPARRPRGEARRPGKAAAKKRMRA